MGSKTRNIAIQLVLQQCCKTSCTFFVARFSVPLRTDLWNQGSCSLTSNFRSAPSEQFPIRRQLTVSDEKKKPQNFRDDQSFPKTSEQKKGFQGSSKSTKQASTAQRKPNPNSYERLSNASADYNRILHSLKCHTSPSPNPTRVRGSRRVIFQSRYCVPFNSKEK